MIKVHCITSQVRSASSGIRGCFLVEVAMDHGNGVRVGLAEFTEPTGLVSFSTQLSLADPGRVVAHYRVTLWDGEEGGRDSTSVDSMSEHQDWKSWP